MLPRIYASQPPSPTATRPSPHAPGLLPIDTSKNTLGRLEGIVVAARKPADVEKLATTPAPLIAPWRSDNKTNVKYW